jgi:hypothetical protein
MPVTPEVEVPPKASSSTAPGTKDVINLDDIPEEPTADSGKGASSSKPPLEETESASAEATANDAKKKLLLSGATGTPQTHPHFFLVLQKVPLAQRHAEMMNLMNEVWGKPETEQQDLATLEDNLLVFFAKHKAVRQVILAPKHWFRYFQVKCVSRCFNCITWINLGGNLKFPSTRRILTSRPAPQILSFRLTIPNCFTEHMSTARGPEDAGAGAEGGDREVVQEGGGGLESGYGP